MLQRHSPHSGGVPEPARPSNLPPDTVTARPALSSRENTSRSENLLPRPRGKSRTAASVALAPARRGKCRATPADKTADRLSPARARRVLGRPATSRARAAHPARLIRSILFARSNAFAYTRPQVTGWGCDGGSGCCHPGPATCPACNGAPRLSGRSGCRRRSGARPAGVVRARGPGSSPRSSVSVTAVPTAEH